MGHCLRTETPFGIKSASSTSASDRQDTSRQTSRARALPDEDGYPSGRFHQEVPSSSQGPVENICSESMITNSWTAVNSRPDGSFPPKRHAANSLFGQSRRWAILEPLRSSTVSMDLPIKNLSEQVLEHGG